MEYTVKKLAHIAGVSTRTLRYYDEIGILKPARINSSGYRMYGQAEVDRLQQILFYKELGVSLDNIGEIINSPSFDRLTSLKEHREKLMEKRKQLDLIIANVNKTISSIERGINMDDKEKFEGLKQKMIDENEKDFGQEIRTKYGDEKVNQANDMIKGMTKEQYAEWERQNSVVIETLINAMATGDPAGELAQKTADLHRQWLEFTWDNYTKDAHARLAQMYVDDERFASYYDQHQSGAAEFLRDAILIYTGKNE
ncbi:MAG: MerR family transcriptional regulator [Syntrophaceticus sp.]|jgi:DNA-binding transcriptional MerR regulator